MTDRLLVYGRTTAADRAAITNYKATWEDIARLFENPVRRSISMAQYQASSPKDRARSKNTGLFFGGECAEGKRGDSTLVCRSIVNLDLDDHCDHIWDALQLTGEIPGLDGLAYLVHTTRSHTEDTPKLRILLPLARDATPAEYEPVARALAERIDSSMEAVARESYTPAQGMYFPSVSKDQDYTFTLIEGEFFDPDDALALYPADDASKWPKRKREKVSEYVAGRKMTHPEDKKKQAPIIAAVHRAFDPYHFIDEFLSDIYIPSGDRYYPVGATGAPSVRIYDDAFVHSDHGSDPACGQHNVFDLGRIHLFGHLDDDYDTEGMPPSEWPSYKAMVDFMMEREEVREHLADIERELEAERNTSMMSLLDELDDDPEDPVDELDDLIGDVEEAAPSIEDVIRKARRSIERAVDSDDLQRRIEVIRAFPVTDFSKLNRERICGDIQKKFKELTGEALTKAVVRKMLEPTVEDLRSRLDADDIPEWLADWVYIAGENKFFNLITKHTLSREGFDGTYAVQAGEKFGVTQTGVSIISPSMVALALYAIPTPIRTCYYPGKPVLFDDEGVLVVNTYRAPMVPDGGYTGKEGVKLLKRLLQDLFPEREHREIVMDFMAHVVRYPEHKLRYALLIKGQEDEGKSLLATLLTKLVGARNYGVIGSDQLKEKFNGWAHEKVLCVVEEIKIPGREAHDVLNKIKPVITNHEVAVRRMQKDVTTERNFCNMLLTTNFENCLPLDEDNTRFAVLFTRFRTNQEVKDWRAQLLKDEGHIYLDKLWDHINERPAQFLEAFERYEFSPQYNPRARAPDTVFKRVMAEDSKTDERKLLEELLESEVDPTITSDVLVWSSFRYVLDEHGLAPNLRGSAVAGFLKPLGFVKANRLNIREGDTVKTLYVWTRNTEMVMSNYDLTDDGKRRVVDAWTAKRAADDAAFDNDEPCNVVYLKDRL